MKRDPHTRLSWYCLLLVALLLPWCWGLLLDGASAGSFVLRDTTRAGLSIAAEDYDYATWGEYGNRVYGFRLRFPRDLYCIYEDPAASEDEISSRDKFGTIFYGQRMMLFTVCFGDVAVPVFCVSVYKNPEGLTPAEFALKDVLSMHIYKRDEMQLDTLRVDGYQAARLRYKNKVGGYDGFVTPVYVRCRDRVYGFDLLTTTHLQGRRVSYEELHDLILATLRIHYGAR